MGDQQTANRRQGYSDMPAELDSLGMNEKYNGLTQFICECETPMTIAINGDWGSGKSSAMMIIQKRLEFLYGGEIRKQIINFNTWEFSVINDHTKLVFELMHTLNDRLMDLEASQAGEGRDQKQGTAAERVLAGVMRLGDAARNVAVTFIDESTSLKYLSSAVKALCERTSPEPQLEQPDQLSATRLMKLVKEDIESRIQKLVGGLANPRLFIFVDDLDRLDPQVALDLIEGMKNFASYQHCVFILAVDQSVVERGLKSKYGAELTAGMAKQFFDKIIQLPFQLPVNSYDLTAYVSSLLKVAPDEAKPFVELLRRFGIRNPRTIKRSLNMLRMVQCINTPQSGVQEDAQELAVRQYAVLLLQLTRESDHTLLVSQIVEDDLAAMHANFQALRSDESGVEREYIAAVLDQFYTEEADSLNATEQLQNILLYTKSEDVRQDNLTAVQFIRRLFRELGESQPEMMGNSEEWREVTASTKTTLSNREKDLRVDYQLRNLQGKGWRRMIITYRPNSTDIPRKAFVTLYAQRFNRTNLNQHYPGSFLILPDGESPSGRQDGVFECYCTEGRLTVFAGCHRNTDLIFQLMRDWGFLKQ